MAVLKQKQAVFGTSKPKNVGKYMVLAFKGLQSHVKCMVLALSRPKNVGKYMVLGSRSLQSHVKCIVLVLSRPENTVNHMVLAFTQPQNPVKYMVLASSKPIYQRRISKLPYAKGGCPNYHMPKADVQITICQRRMSKGGRRQSHNENSN